MAWVAAAQDLSGRSLLRFRSRDFRLFDTVPTLFGCVSDLRPAGIPRFVKLGRSPGTLVGWPHQLVSLAASLDDRVNTELVQHHARIAQRLSAGKVNCSGVDIMYASACICKVHAYACVCMCVRTMSCAMQARAQVCGCMCA